MGFFTVGMTRFELATPRPPDVCATGLRYIPKFIFPLRHESCNGRDYLPFKGRQM